MGIRDLKPSDYAGLRCESDPVLSDAANDWPADARLVLDDVANSTAATIGERWEDIGVEGPDGWTSLYPDASEIATEVAQEVANRLLGIIALMEQRALARMSAETPAAAPKPKTT